MFLTCATARLASTHTIKALFLKVVLSVSIRRLRRCGVPGAVCCGSGKTNSQQRVPLFHSSACLFFILSDLCIIPF